MSHIPADIPANFNITLLEDTDLCTLLTCPLSLANFTYIPNLFGNALFIGIFGLAIIAQTFLTIKYKTWGYGAAMFGGLALEVVGYSARIQMHFNPFASDPFLMYLVCLTIGPAFLSAAIYLCLSRIVIVFSETISRFKPATYTLLFMACDFVSLLLQAIGGGMASAADTADLKITGKNIMVAGVAWQVFSMALFFILCYDLYRQVKKASEDKKNPAFATFRHSKKFEYFLYSLAVATVTIFIRSVFRCAELSGGFDGPMANDEISFMILEGAMICIAVICLTIFHPGLIFKGNWNKASWNVRSRKSTAKRDEKALDYASFADGQPYKINAYEEVLSVPYSSTGTHTPIGSSV